MASKANFTYKQERQIISFFENSHANPFLVPGDIAGCAVIALFRACRAYCIDRAANRPWDKEGREAHRERCRAELIERLDKLTIRYYEKI